VCGVAVVVWDDDVWLCVMKRDWIARFDSSIRVASFFSSAITLCAQQRTVHNVYIQVIMVCTIHHDYISGTAVEEDTQKFKISFTTAF
jgi:hypothetical protein